LDDNDFGLQLMLTETFAASTQSNMLNNGDDLATANVATPAETQLASKKVARPLIGIWEQFASDDLVFVWLWND